MELIAEIAVKTFGTLDIIFKNKVAFGLKPSILCSKAVQVCLFQLQRHKMRFKRFFRRNE